MNFRRGEAPNTEFREKSPLYFCHRFITNLNLTRILIIPILGSEFLYLSKGETIHTLVFLFVDRSEKLQPDLQRLFKPRNQPKCLRHLSACCHVRNQIQRFHFTRNESAVLSHFQQRNPSFIEVHNKFDKLYKSVFNYVCVSKHRLPKYTVDTNEFV